MKNKIALNEVNIKKAIKTMMLEANIDSMAELARQLEVKETTLRSAINNDAIRLVDFKAAASLMGYKIVLEPMDSEQE